MVCWNFKVIFRADKAPFKKNVPSLNNSEVALKLGSFIEFGAKMCC